MADVLLVWTTVQKDTHVDGFAAYRSADYGGLENALMAAQNDYESLRALPTTYTASVAVVERSTDYEGTKHPEVVYLIRAEGAE